MLPFNRLRLLWVALVLVLLASRAWAAGERPLRVCLDPEPPPWSYWVRDAQGHKTGELSGFSVELVRKAFERAGLAVAFEGGLPWARCIRSVSWGDIDFAMEVYYSDERARSFTFSRAYNTLTPQIFFLKARPVAVTSAQGLKRYRGCGLRDVSYDHYGVSASDMDLSLDLSAVTHKLKSGRCDYFLGEIEEIEAYHLAGKGYLDDDALTHAPVPFAQPPTSHLVARRGSPAAALMPRLDAAIEHLVSSGEAARIWARYSNGIGYRP